MSLSSASQTDDKADGDVEDDMDSDEEYDSDERQKTREIISNKLKKLKSEEKATDDEERGKKPSRRYDDMILTRVS